MMEMATTHGGGGQESTRLQTTMCGHCRDERGCSVPMTVKAAVLAPATENVIIVLQCGTCGAWTMVVD